MWNIVLVWIIELKKRYKEKYGIDSYDIKELVEKVGDGSDKDRYSCLMVGSYKDYRIIHYSKFNTIPSKQLKNFWTKYSGFFLECRSLVINIKTDEIILAPYPKFFNIDEVPGWRKEEVEEKIRKAKVVYFTDKMDGSMQSYRILPDLNELICSGSLGMDPELSERVRVGRKIFCSDPAYYDMCSSHPWYTFIFELIYPEIDPHVVQYPKEKWGLWLTGIRDVRDGRLLDYRETVNIAEIHGVKHIEVYRLTLEQAYSVLDKWPGSEKEGFVIGADDFRAKLKFNDFLGLQRIVHGLFSNNIIAESVIQGTFDDLLSRLPEPLVDRAEQIRDRVVEKIVELRGNIDKIIERVLKETREMKTLPEKLGYVTKNYKGSGVSGSIISYLKTGHYELVKIKKEVDLDKLIHLSALYM